MPTFVIDTPYSNSGMLARWASPRPPRGALSRPLHQLPNRRLGRRFGPVKHQPREKLSGLGRCPLPRPWIARAGASRDAAPAPAQGGAASRTSPATP
jgi:hypothetical protein